MINIGDTTYTFDSQLGVCIPVDGKIMDMHQKKDDSDSYDVYLEMNLPYDDYFCPTRIIGEYKPGLTLSKGGCEYIWISDTDIMNSRLNCYIFLDRIFNLQLCLQQSVLFINNSKHYAERILKELRSLGYEPPSDIAMMMNGFGLV